MIPFSVAYPNGLMGVVVTSLYVNEEHDVDAFVAVNQHSLRSAAYQRSKSVLGNVSLTLSY
jgi:hypothetical protein